MDETRERFLTAIAARLGAERIVELHLFSPLRQGMLETGVAVVAVRPDLSGPGQGEPGQGEPDQGEPDQGEPDQGEPDQSESGAEEPDTPVDRPAEPRHVVYTARYRLTRKGPDRGKWFFEVVAQADAPLATVDTVVRGVMQRSKDLTETERLGGDQLRSLLSEPAWRTAP